MAEEKDNNFEKEIIDWWAYKDAHPHKPYEQSEKYGEYFQRVEDYYDKLHQEWLKYKQTINPLNR